MRQAQRRAARNQAARSAVRTFYKKASVAVTAANTRGDNTADVVREAVSALDKAAQRGIIHRNAAARRKSRLMSRLHQLSLTPESEPKQAASKATDSKATATKSRAKTTATAEKKPATRKPAAKKTTSKSKD
jgi:small subunit ribosomal protein S20